MNTDEAALDETTKKIKPVLLKTPELIYKQLSNTSTVIGKLVHLKFPKNIRYAAPVKERLGITKSFKVCLCVGVEEIDAKAFNQFPHIARETIPDNPKRKGFVVYLFFANKFFAVLYDGFNKVSKTGKQLKAKIAYMRGITDKNTLAKHCNLALGRNVDNEQEYHVFGKNIRTLIGY